MKTPEKGPFFHRPANEQAELVPGIPLVLSNAYLVVEQVLFGTGNNDTRVEYVNPVPGLQSPTAAEAANTYFGNFSLRYVAYASGVAGTSVQWDEFRIGEHFVDVAPLPPVILSNIQYSSGTMRFSFLSETGQLYAIESRSDLLTGNWSGLTNVLGDGNLVQVVIQTTNTPIRYFRVRTP